MKKILSIIAAIFAVTVLFAVCAFSEENATANIYIGPLNSPYNSVYVEDESGNRYTAERKTNSKPFAFSLPKGDYSWIFEDTSGSVTAKGNFKITDGTDVLNIYLKRIDFEFDCSEIQSTEYPDFGAVVTMTNTDGEEITGAKTAGYFFTADGLSTEKWSFIVEAKGTDYKYSYNIKMNDEGLLLTEGEASGRKSYAAKKSTAVDTVRVVPVADFNSVTFKVTKNAGMGLYKKTGKHYTAFYEYNPAMIDTDSDENYDIYVYNIPKKASGKIHMVAGGSEGATDQITSVIYGETDGWSAEFLKTARIFSVKTLEEEYTIDVEKLDNSDRRSCAYFLGGDSSTVEADMYLNVPDSNFINLTCEPFELRAYRVNQAQYGAVENYFIEPDFHYEVVSGNSVTVTPSYSDITGLPQPGNEYAVITPVDIGVSIIKVSYDAMSLQEGNNTAAYFNATDDANVRYVVVNVTKEPVEETDMGITVREYDTVYYTKKTVQPDGTEVTGNNFAPFGFTPESDVKISVQSPLNGDEWISYSANDDGSYTVNLYEGENIIKAESSDKESYYVVSAKGITAKIENKTCEGKAVTLGDTARISFEGISLPNKKLAGIYNPGYPNTTWVHYACSVDECSQNGLIDNAEDGTVKSRGAQYVVAGEKYNGIEFVVLKSGNITLSGGKIHSEHMGAALDSHRLIDGSGVAPNLDASNNTENAEFSFLPDITISVAEKQNVPTGGDKNKGESILITIGSDAAKNGEANPNTGAEVPGFVTMFAQR